MNYRNPSMSTFKFAFQSQTLLVSLISSEYTSAYTETDINKYPAISFPVNSCYGYEAEKTKLLLDTNHVLFEKDQTEFSVSKYPIFRKDLTLCIQFIMANEVLQHLFSKPKPHIQVQRRSVETEILLRKFLSIAFKNDEFLKEQVLIDIINTVSHESFKNNLAVKTNPLSIRQVDNSKDFIHDNFGEKLSISDIASSACLSPFHFSRLFRQITGYSPYDYLLLTRIENAKLLLSKNIPVTQAAFTSGFNSVDNFSYTFRRIVGCSPSSWKKARFLK